jgi:HAD superfamily hydrolase (TIGR01509 family)
MHVTGFRGVLLDIDGTLVDSNDAHAMAWSDAFAERELDIAPLRVRRLIGMGGEYLVNIVAGYVKDSDAYREVSKRHDEIFRDRYLARVHAFPKSRELVLQLRRRGFAYAVATSGEPELVSTLLEIADVGDLCEIRTTAGDVAHPKPAPDVIEAALARIPVERARAVLIGDTPYDIRAARSAGIATIGMASGGFPPEQLAGAIAVYLDPADLLARWDTSPLANCDDQCRARKRGHG